MIRPGDVRVFDVVVVEPVRQKRETRSWTSLELRAMREHAHLGIEAVALLLGRSATSVRLQSARFRISLRTEGERRGLVLGQPRGQAILPRIRGDIMDGTVSDEAIAARMALSRDAALCPVCARRPIEVASSGWCLPCHRERLVSAHLAELEVIDSQRSLWSSRQALCRARKSAEA